MVIQITRRDRHTKSEQAKLIGRRLRKLDSCSLVWNYNVLVINARRGPSPDWMRTSHQQRLADQRPLYAAEFRRCRLKVPDPANVPAFEALLLKLQPSRRTTPSFDSDESSRLRRTFTKSRRSAKKGSGGRNGPKCDAMSRRLPGSGWTRER